MFIDTGDPVVDRTNLMRQIKMKMKKIITDDSKYEYNYDDYEPSGFEYIDEDESEKDDDGDDDDDDDYEEEFIKGEEKEIVNIKFRKSLDEYYRKSKNCFRKRKKGFR